MTARIIATTIDRDGLAMRVLANGESQGRYTPEDKWRRFIPAGIEAAETTIARWQEAGLAVTIIDA